MITYNLISTVNFATRMQNSSTTVLDNTFVDSVRFGKSSAFPIVNGQSDHDDQCLMINNNIAAAGDLNTLEAQSKESK